MKLYYLVDKNTVDNKKMGYLYDTDEDESQLFNNCIFEE